MVKNDQERNRGLSQEDTCTVSVLIRFSLSPCPGLFSCVSVSPGSRARTPPVQSLPSSKCSVPLLPFPPHASFWFFPSCQLLFAIRLEDRLGLPGPRFEAGETSPFSLGPSFLSFLPFACASSIQAELGLPLSLYFLSAACSFRSGAANWQPESHLQPQAWLQIGTFYDKIRISSLSWETGSFLHSRSTLGRSSCPPLPRAHIPLLTPVSAVTCSLTTSRQPLTWPVGDTALHCLTVTSPDPKLLSMQ